MKVVAITATAGRHTCIERSIRFFLDQDYPDCKQIIYQNSPVYQQLDSSVDSSKVILINQHLDSQTGERYKSLGAIYNDILKHIPEDTDVVCFWDDDDIFNKNHISEGVRGLIRGGLKAYKPSHSLFRSLNGIHRIENTLEPSIFVKWSHIKEHKFSLTTTEQHLQWVDPLVYGKQIFVDPNGPATLCYNWGDTFPTFKTSGNPSNPENFDNYHKSSVDHGDSIITPVSTEAVSEFYKIFTNV